MYRAFHLGDGEDAFINAVKPRYNGQGCESLNYRSVAV